MAKSKEEIELKKRWQTKRKSIHSLKRNIDRLKRQVRKDLDNASTSEKDRLTALIVRIMLFTNERVGNEGSAKDGHYGVSFFKSKHVKVIGNRIYLKYVGKSGVKHEKCFCNTKCASLIKELLKKRNRYLFTTSDGFKINPDRVNRYLSRFNATSKDIRGYNANYLMVTELRRIGKTEEKQRPKTFNSALRKISAKVGHGSATLRKHYLLPEIETNFYNHGSVGRIKI